MYAEIVKGYVPPADINKLTISGDVLSIAVGAAWRAGDKGASAFIRRAVESTAEREFEMWQKKQAAISLLESARAAEIKTHNEDTTDALNRRLERLLAEQTAPGNSGDLPSEQEGPKTLGD